MPVTTQSIASLNKTRLDDGFAKQLESMLGGVSAARLSKKTQIERQLEPV